jgi:hypothetical protein
LLFDPHLVALPDGGKIAMKLPHSHQAKGIGNHCRFRAAVSRACARDSSVRKFRQNLFLPALRVTGNA